MTTIVTHAIGRSGDPIITFAAEKCNCTQVAEMTFDRLGLGEEARAYSSWIHDYRWDVYQKTTIPPSVDDIVRANRGGCITLKFVRDPVDRFASIWKRYLSIGIRGCPPGLDMDSFLSWFESIDITRYKLGAYSLDDHITTQRFFGERDEMWTEIIHVEDLCDKRDYLRDTYGLIVDPDWTSNHWIHMDVDLTPEQIERIERIYACDMLYRRR